MYKYVILSGITLSCKVRNISNILAWYPVCMFENHSKLVWHFEIKCEKSIVYVYNLAHERQPGWLQRNVMRMAPVWRDCLQKKF